MKKLKVFAIIFFLSMCLAGCGGTEDAYRNTPSRGDRVRVITGQCCPRCGSKEGTFFPGDYGLGCGITCDGCKGIYSIDSYKIGVGVELI